MGRRHFRGAGMARRRAFQRVGRASGRAPAWEGAGHDGRRPVGWSAGCEGDRRKKGQAGLRDLGAVAKPPILEPLQFAGSQILELFLLPNCFSQRTLNGASRSSPSCCGLTSLNSDGGRPQPNSCQALFTATGPHPHVVLLCK